MLKLFKKKRDDEEFSFYEADDYDYVEGEVIFAEEDQAKERPLNLKVYWLLGITLYLGYVVLGGFSTSFATNPQGVREAQIINVELREEREHYQTFKDEYQNLENLLASLQVMDEKLVKSGGKDGFILATEYQKILEQMEPKVPIVKALEVPPKYEPAKKLVSQIYEDLAIYLQKVGLALTNQDGAMLQEAFSWRNKTIDDFKNLQGTMKQFSVLVKLEDSSYDKMPIQPFASKESKSPTK